MLKTIIALAALATVAVAPAYAVDGTGTHNGTQLNGGGNNGGGSNGAAAASSTLSIEAFELPAKTR